MALPALPLLEWSRGRQAIYSFLSALFLYPDPERLSLLYQMAHAFSSGKALWASFGFFLPLIRLVETLSRLRDGGPAQVQQEYTRLFLLDPLAPPYESFYRDPQGPGRAWVVVQVKRAYAEAGLAASPDTGQPADFIATELEFMASLCAREAEAWEEEREGVALDLCRRQRSFLDGHLARWASSLAERVREASPHGFYALAAEAAHAFTHHDLDWLTLLLDLGGQKGGVYG